MSSANLTFSIVVNTVDRALPLHNLLRALANQSYPHFEVVIVVGPTKDNTLEIIEPYRHRVRLQHCETANLSQSRNLGLLAARGDIVAFIDDDAIPSYHWLAQLNRLFSDTNLTGTGGKVYRINPENAVIQHQLGIASGLAEQVDVRHSRLDSIVPPGDGYQWQGRMMGTNMAFRRQALLNAGGFDEFYQWVFDDTDIALSLANAGFHIQPVKETVVYHAPASSRNRQVNTSVGNWWIQTKAAFYFNIKHGPTGGNNWRQIGRRCLHLWHGHLLWYAQLRRRKRLSVSQHWQMRLREARGVLSGTWHGLRRAPQKIPPAHRAAQQAADEPILPFPEPEPPAAEAAVDPISGRQPAISVPEPPLRICLMSAAYPPHQYEGVGRHTNLMAQGLFECGHTVHVITRASAESVSFYDGAFVHAIPATRERYGRYRLFPRLHNTLNYSHAAFEQVKRLLLNDGIQVVDTPLWQMDGLVTAVSGNVPVALRLQTAHKQISNIQNEQTTDARLLGDMEQALIRQADHVIPNSQATLQAMSQVYQTELPPARTTIIPHGIVPVPETDVRLFDPGNPPAQLTVLFVGRLEIRKGIQDLFQAIPKVVRQVPQVQFIIVGADNSLHDGFQARHGLAYPDYFQKKHPDLAGQVQFTGAVSEETLQAHYQACDLFVAPSLYESFGLIYLEAMNYGKPVIGCRAGGIPEVIDDKVTGWLVEPAAPADLAAAIVKLCRDPQKLADLGLAGRQRLLQKFTHVQMAQQFAAVYRRMIESG